MLFRRAFLLAFPCLALAQPDKPLPVPEEEVQRVIREVSDLARTEDPEWGAETLYRLARVLKQNYPSLAGSVREASRKRAAEIPSAITRAGYLAMVLSDDKSDRVTPEQVAGACLAIPPDNSGSNEPALVCLRAAYENFRADGVTAYELVFLRAALSLGRVSAFPVSDILRRQPSLDTSRFVNEYVTRLNPDDIPAAEIEILLSLLAQYPSTHKEALGPALHKLARALPRLPESPACTLKPADEPLAFGSPRALFAFQLRKVAAIAKLPEILESIPESEGPSSQAPLDDSSVVVWLAAEVAIPDVGREADDKREQEWGKFLDTASSDKLPEPLSSLPVADAWEKIEAEPNGAERLSLYCALARRKGRPADRLDTVRRARFALGRTDNELIRATALFFLSSSLIESELDSSLGEQMFRESLTGYTSIAAPILKGERPYLRQFPANYEELTSIAWIFAMASGETKIGLDLPLVRSRIPVLTLQSRLGVSKSWFSLAP